MINSKPVELDDLQYYTVETLPDFLTFITDCVKNYKDLNAYCYKKNGEVIYKSFQEFKEDVISAANVFINKGYSGKHIALIGENCYEWIVSYFGIIISNNVVMPIDRKLPITDMSSILTMGDADIVILGTQESSYLQSIQEKCNSIKESFTLSKYFYENHSTDCSKLPKTNPNEMAILMFTSGTTGMSKGAMLSQQNLISNVIAIAKTSELVRSYNIVDYYGNKVDKVTSISVLPYNHIFEMCNIIRNLFIGVTTAIVSNIQELGESLALYKPFNMAVVPAIADFIMAGILVKLNKVGISIEMVGKSPELKKQIRGQLGGNLNILTIGGAPPNPKTRKFFDSLDVILQEGYGMTETSPIIASQPFTPVPDGSCGSPLVGVSVKIVNGEILVKGPNVLLGYYKNEKATKDAFDEEGYFKTGDLGEFDGKYLKVLGRSKNVIILPNGENIYPEEYEMKLQHSNSAIREIVVYEHDNQICAEILSINPTDKNLESTISKTIDTFNLSRPAYMRITSVHFREVDFIKTTSGKIKRDFLNKEHSKEMFEEPVTEMEKKVCDVFKGLLNVSTISRGSNFFTLGGDSMSAYSATSELNVLPELLYANPTVKDFAKAIEKVRQEMVNENPDPFNVNELIKNTEKKQSDTTPKRILLTGANGFLGSHILYDLTKRDCEIWCMIRNEEKFKKAVSYYFEDIDLSKVHLLVGDIEQLSLGLSDGEYTKLTEVIDTVIHVAANVHHTGDYKKLRLTNYTGTKNVVAFAKEANAILHHTSTYSLSGSGIVRVNDTGKVFDESILNIGQCYKDNVYIHSKYISEEYVLKERANGLIANIYRIGNLTWRTSDGKFQVNATDNGFLSRMSALAKLRVTNDKMNKYLNDFTSVDECAKAYVTLVFSKRTGEIFGLYNPNLYTSGEVLSLAGISYKTVGEDELKYMLYDNRDDKDVRTLAFYAMNSENSEWIPMNNDYTVGVLRKLGFEWSKASKEYVQMYINDKCVLTAKKHEDTFGVISPTYLKFGKGALNNLEGIPILGKKALMVINSGTFLKDSGYLDKVTNQLNTLGIEVVLYDKVQANPTKDNVIDGVKFGIDNNCDFVIGFGGGSAIDTAKAIAILSTNQDVDLFDYKVSNNAITKTIDNKPLPLMIISTTAGTGSEVDNYFVISDTDKQEKPLLGGTIDNYPQVAIDDPSITMTLPKNFTAYQGFDALFHAVECYIANRHNMMCDMYCLKAVELLSTYLPIAVTNGNNEEAREKIMFASVLSGYAMSMSAVISEHALEHAISGVYENLPHGAGLIMISKEYHKMFIGKHACDARYVDLARAMGVETMHDASDFITALSILMEKCGVADLKMSDYGVKKDDVKLFVEKARESVGILFMCDPCALTNKELITILENSYK